MKNSKSIWFISKIISFNKLIQKKLWNRTQLLTRFCIVLFCLFILFLSENNLFAIQPNNVSKSVQATALNAWTSTLNTNWFFATDTLEQGMVNGWYTENFNDSGWKTLKSGLSWEKQNITHQGWGWYRQKITIPAGYEGTPLVLKLGNTKSDDDAFVNGVRIGSNKSEYKYNNMMQRVYTVPASLLHYGQTNTIAIRVWGGNLSSLGSVSGLASGIFRAEINPFCILAGEIDQLESTFQHINLFDFSDRQRGKPFKLIFRYPSSLITNGATQLTYTINDYYNKSIISGSTSISSGTDGTANTTVIVDSMASQKIYLRGRFIVSQTVGSSSKTLSSIKDSVDCLSFARRDTLSLVKLNEKWDETPYGSLKLVDEITCSNMLSNEDHGYMQSTFTNKTQWYNTPGDTVTAPITTILGKKAREVTFGWFAYKIGRGKLSPRKTYLLRIEYPEDKPRYCPIEIQVGQNYMDAGWRSGVGIANDPYDNWPLSNSWQFYDLIVPLDDQTVGSGGTGCASAESGFWVYFMNKNNGKYFAMYKNNGPAISSIRLYEIDPQTNSPVINKPTAGLPQRTLMFDWERQPDHEPADLVNYAKLMGYNSISPVILKWAFQNYSNPMKGYTSVNIDRQNYWTKKEYINPVNAIQGEAPVPGKESVFNRYLTATKGSGVNFVPRIEYGGSTDLALSAHATNINGTPSVPNRFNTWCSDLLDPLTFTDMKNFVDHLIKPYVNDNPQLTGILWRIRCDMMPISYSDTDVALYNSEMGTSVTRSTLSSVSSEKNKYADWWHLKRRDFHAKLVDLLKSYRSDLRLYYYNWDEDKFSMILSDLNKGKFYTSLTGIATYQADRTNRNKITTSQYINVINSGDFSANLGISSPDYGLRPTLYNNVSGIELLAPANILHLANNSGYLNYFKTADGVSVSNCVSYDEINSRSINPKFECNVTTPGGPSYSMAFELMNYFHADARTLTYTAYTYGRGFAQAHRRFAQAFLALPAITGTVIDSSDVDVKVRVYKTSTETYIGVANKAYTSKTITVKIPITSGQQNITVKDLVSGNNVPVVISGNQLQFSVNSGPVELNSYLLNVPSATGLESNKVIPSIELFPNPIEDVLNIKLESIELKIINVTIVDMFGKDILKGIYSNVNLININTSSLPKGTYICRITSNNQTSNTKFVK